MEMIAIICIVLAGLLAMMCDYLRARILSSRFTDAELRRILKGSK